MRFYREFQVQHMASGGADLMPLELTAGRIFTGVWASFLSLKTVSPTMTSSATGRTRNRLSRRFQLSQLCFWKAPAQLRKFRYMSSRHVVVSYTGGSSRQYFQGQDESFIHIQAAASARLLLCFSVRYEAASAQIDAVFLLDLSAGLPTGPFSTICIPLFPEVPYILVAG